MTIVSVNTYTHSVTYVTDNILKSLKDIIRLSGLDPTEFVENWGTYTSGIKSWLESEHLKKVILEIYNPITDKLIIRWDIDIVYSWSSDSGSFWTDTDQLRYAILKTGILPSQIKYRLVLENKPGRPDAIGWSSTNTRSTDGMVRQALGITVDHNGLGAQGAYWRNR